MNQNAEVQASSTTTRAASSEQESARYDRSNQHLQYPISDWEYEVVNADTLLGYHEWVVAKIEAAQGGL